MTITREQMTEDQLLNLARFNPLNAYTTGTLADGARYKQVGGLNNDGTANWMGDDNVLYSNVSRADAEARGLLNAGDYYDSWRKNIGAEYALANQSPTGMVGSTPTNVDPQVVAEGNSQNALYDEAYRQIHEQFYDPTAPGQIRDQAGYQAALNSVRIGPDGKVTWNNRSGLDLPKHWKSQLALIDRFAEGGAVTAPSSPYTGDALDYQSFINQYNTHSRPTGTYTEHDSGRTADYAVSAADLQLPPGFDPKDFTYTPAMDGMVVKATRADGTTFYLDRAMALGAGRNGANISIEGNNRSVNNNFQLPPEYQAMFDKQLAAENETRLADHVQRGYSAESYQPLTQVTDAEVRDREPGTIAHDQWDTTTGQFASLGKGGSRQPKNQYRMRMYDPLAYNQSIGRVSDDGGAVDASAGAPAGNAVPRVIGTALSIVTGNPYFAMVLNGGRALSEGNYLGAALSALPLVGELANVASPGLFEGVNAKNYVGGNFGATNFNPMNTMSAYMRDTLGLSPTVASGALGAIQSAVTSKGDPLETLLGGLASAASTGLAQELPTEYKFLAEPVVRNAMLAARNRNPSIKPQDLLNVGVAAYAALNRQ